MNSGKSSTLKAFISLLLQEYNAEIIEKRQSKLISENFWEVPAEDGFVILKFDEIQVGIITAGDPGYAQTTKDLCCHCIDKNCDIIVAASRTWGGVHNALVDFARENKSFVVETYPIHGRDFNNGISKDLYEIFNKIDADTLYKIIKGL